MNFSPGVTNLHYFQVFLILAPLTSMSQGGVSWRISQVLHTTVKCQYIFLLYVDVLMLCVVDLELCCDNVGERIKSGCQTLECCGCTLLTEQTAS